MKDESKQCPHLHIDVSRRCVDCNYLILDVPEPSTPDCTPENETLCDQIDRLGQFILDNCKGYPKGSAGAVDTAIQIIIDQKQEIADLANEIQEMGEYDGD